MSCHRLPVHHGSAQSTPHPWSLPQITDSGLPVPPWPQLDLDGSVFQDVDLLKTLGNFPLMIIRREITVPVMISNGQVLC